jgi:DNA-binding transcriptional LysR family regulator
LVLALPESHALARKKVINLADLRENWVMVSRAAAPAFRRQFDQLCAGASMRPRVVQESDRAAAVLTMVAAEQGISLLPESVSPLIKRGVVFRPLTGRPPVLEHAFAYRSGESDAGVLEFVKLLG